MAGLATETMVASTRIMKNPTSIAHSAFHGFAVGAVVRRIPGARSWCRVVRV
jgi:hypothetical protein